jgi:hypothetical protein
MQSHKVLGGQLHNVAHSVHGTIAGMFGEYKPHCICESIAGRKHIIRTETKKEAAMFLLPVILRPVLRMVLFRKNNKTAGRKKSNRTTRSEVFAIFLRDYHFPPIRGREWRWLVEYNHQVPLSEEHDGGGWLNMFSTDIPVELEVVG